ncbi:MULTISPECIES: hypothetical protein [unclassified Bradyrhizobium]|uniref:hypothetical protein n=1 Tax=unclassified Bradyrhizobium TaxID=2631580 RepID=UPI0029165544|nr:MULTISPECIES: hypothetical protein [unclassified Bradyrhizobium]
MFAPTLKGRPRPIVYGTDDGGVTVELRKNEGRARKRDGEYTLAMSPLSPLDWHEPAPLHIGECRTEWVTWCNALDDLARTLAGRLATIEVHPRTVRSCRGATDPRRRARARWPQTHPGGCRARRRAQAQRRRRQAGGVANRGRDRPKLCAGEPAKDAQTRCSLRGFRAISDRVH